MCVVYWLAMQKYVHRVCFVYALVPYKNQMHFFQWLVTAQQLPILGNKGGYFFYKMWQVLRRFSDVTTWSTDKEHKFGL